MFSIARRLFVAGAARTAGQTLPYPIVPCPPIAVFSHHFATTAQAIRLEHEIDLASSHARSVAAPLSVLRAIDPGVWMPEYPLVVLSCVTRGLLAEDDRDWLWDKFRVPVFEYLLNSLGRIVAEECEAHEGLHVNRGAGDLPGMLLRDVCACGKSTPRLLRRNGIIEESLAVSTLKQEWRNWQTHQT